MATGQVAEPVAALEVSEEFDIDSVMETG